MFLIIVIRNEKMKVYETTEMKKMGRMNVFLIWEDISKCDAPCTVSKWGEKWIIDTPEMGLGGLSVVVAMGGLQLVCDF